MRRSDQLVTVICPICGTGIATACHLIFEDDEQTDYTSAIACCGKDCNHRVSTASNKSMDDAMFRAWEHYVSAPEKGELNEHC